MRSALSVKGMAPFGWLVKADMWFLLAMVGAVGIAISVGAVEIPIYGVLSNNLDELQKAVLTEIRLPRVLLAGLVGAALAVSGAAMQGLFRNSLADPGLIGISGGAALAVGLLIVIGGKVSGTFGLYAMGVAAFTGGLVASLLIFKIASAAGRFSVTYLLLAGIAVNALCSAGTGFLTYLSSDQQLRIFTFWTMGSLGGALWPAVIVAATIIIPTIFFLRFYAQNLNILLLGEEEAKYLGVETKTLKHIVVICTTLCVGASVAVSGMIGFVGLLVPHVIRLMVSSDHRRLLPLAAILGATLLILADTLARIIVAPAEMPVGVLTSLIGGPFFLWLLIRHFSNRFGI